MTCHELCQHPGDAGARGANLLNYIHDLRKRIMAFLWCRGTAHPRNHWCEHQDGRRQRHMYHTPLSKQLRVDKTFFRTRSAWICLGYPPRRWSCLVQRGRSSKHILLDSTPARGGERCGMTDERSDVSARRSEPQCLCVDLDWVVLACFCSLISPRAPRAN